FLFYPALRRGRANTLRPASLLPPPSQLQLSAQSILHYVAPGSLFPQIGLDGVGRGILEPHSGVLIARRAVTATVVEAVRLGATYLHALVEAPDGKENLRAIRTKDGEKIPAGQFIFACGSWLSKMFPQIVGPRLFVTRQEVFYFG